MKRTHLGSTSAAPILGISPFGSEHDLWRSLRGLSESRVAPQMLRGLACEPLLAARVAALIGQEIEPVEPIMHPYGHEFMRVSGDYRVRGARRLLELKTAGHFAFASWGGKLAEYYRVQAVIEAWAFDADTVTVPVLVVPESMTAVEALLAGMPVDQMRTAIDALAPLMVEHGEIAIFHVDADPEFARAIVAHMGAWWRRHIVDGEEPRVTASDDFAEYARAAFVEREPLRPATEKEAALLSEYDAARAAVSVAKKRQDNIAAELRAAIGTAAGIKAPGLGYAVARPTSAKTDWKALAVERGNRLQLLGQHTDDTEKHTSPGESRTLSVTLGKERAA
jgi:hypothetical protein